MGIPKFFRWMSERYPLCSQLITENRIPEFDNLYLDMNGIIHHCSHPNDMDAHYRISEEKIFIGIFNYIDHLFTKIKPKKLFFMAVDGVAPRAKMNQQRCRRFRTAKDAAEAIRKAESKGDVLPQEEPFDSNCITPGTEFMARISLQLKYFINKKVTEDANWRGIKIVLSGHEVPGEGEHKIMEYIRNAKAQSDYNPNVRHCLYGLDADLIMLGLLSHDPHFALLREEVTFGPSSKKKKHGPIESQNFYLMHLSVLREYLDLEFSTLRESLPFDYNLERIIDDFILLALFVGNDFIPHLPSLHIAEGALGLMFRVYKEVIPLAGGYINDGGKLNMRRLELIFKELTIFEKETFEGESSDTKWFKGKQKKYQEQIEKDRKNKKLVMTLRQKEIFEQIKDMIDTHSEEAIHFPAEYPARDREFIKNLSSELDIQCSVNEEKHICVQYESEDDTDNIIEIRGKVFEKYGDAEIVKDVDTSEERESVNFLEWKKNYYMEKMNINFDNPEQMDKLVCAYLEGLQWVLHYYYNGVASWGWFYCYHYSPKISDLQDLERFDIKYEYGNPFRPFEQLMGVLPEGSKKIIPAAYQDLMTDPSSPIFEFYPTDFELDLNGKKQNWEAVVKVPFIDQKKLVDALNSREDRLTEDERQRNTFGESLMFTYDSNLNEMYPSSSPGFFPDIHHCQCRMETYFLPTIDGMKLVKGLCDGVQLGAKAMAGFPSLETIPHTGSLKIHGVNVFKAESKNETMVITLINEFSGMKTEDIAKEIVGKRIFVSWPFLQEAMVQAVSDAHSKYELNVHSNSQPGEIIKVNHKIEMLENWRRKADKLEYAYSKRYGTITGVVEVIIHVLMLKGLKRLDNSALVKEYDNIGEEVDYAIQTIVKSVECEDPRYEEKPAIPISEEFPYGTEIFFLDDPFYGCPGQVIANTENNLAVKLITTASNRGEPDFGSKVVQGFFEHVKYFPSYIVAKKLGISGLTLSKLASSLHVICKSTEQRINLGLDLKFETKKQKVLGYTRKSKDGWEYSEKAMNILSLYKQKFPEFIQALENKHKEEIYSAEDFYPKDEAVEKIRVIKDWLKTVEVRDLEKVPLEAEQLDKEAFAKIEKDADEFHKNLTFKMIIVKNIPRHVLLKPEHASTRLQGQNFKLGDRVIFVQDSGSVPIAAKGTVVGIEKTNIDVIFDSTFMSGSTLGDRCSPFRGMTVPGSALLNLTNEQFIDSRKNGSKQGTNHFPKSRTQGSMQNGHHSIYHSSNYHSRGGGGRGSGNMHSNQNYGSNGQQHVRQIMNPGRLRSNGVGVSSGMNGYISTMGARSSPPVHGNKFMGGHIQIYSHNNYRNGFNGNSRGGNGFLHRGNRGGHFNNGISSRGKGKDDGKT